MTKAIEITSYVRGGGVGSRAWVARITGIDSKFGLARAFINGEKNISGSGKSGWIDWAITEPGIYEFRGVQPPKGEASIGDVRSGFFRLTDEGEKIALTKEEVESLFQSA